MVDNPQNKESNESQSPPTHPPAHTPHRASNVWLPLCYVGRSRDAYRVDSLKLSSKYQRYADFFFISLLFFSFSCPMNCQRNRGISSRLMYSILLRVAYSTPKFPCGQPKTQSPTDLIQLHKKNRKGNGRLTKSRKSVIMHDERNVKLMMLPDF